MAEPDSSSLGTGPADLDRGTAHESREIDEVVERLADRFPAAGTDRIRAVVNTEHRKFEDSPIRDFVPVFVERAAKGVLADAPQE